MQNTKTTEFEAFVLGYQKQAFSVAYRITGSVEDAQDAVQEAFVRAFRSREDFRGEAAVTTWFHRVVVNAALDVMRKRKGLPIVVEELPDRAGDSDPRPEESARRAEIRERIRQAVHRLPERQREVFLLKHFENMSVKEVGIALGLAEGTVKVHLSRAVNTLKEELCEDDL
jgi:RNA polymerase sigma-70 factor (ECF subfamily)